MKKKIIFGVAGALVISLGVLFQIARTAGQKGPDNDVLAIVSQSSGQMIIAGRFGEHRIARLNADGTEDASFSKWTAGGFNGPVLALARAEDDSLWVGGEFTNFDTALAGHIIRLHADGSLDTDFASKAGTGFDDSVTSLVLQADGKILVGGRFSSFNGLKAHHLMRLNSDGSVDKTFVGGGIVDLPVNALLALPGGKVLIGEILSALPALKAPIGEYCPAQGRLRLHPLHE